MRYQLTISFFLAIASSAPALAGVTVVEDQENNDGLTVFQMTVTPAAEPVPALRHRFRVPLHLRKPGNAATHYLRVWPEGGLERTWKYVRENTKEEVDRWGRINDLSIAELPLDQVRDAAASFQGHIDTHIDRASRCRECDWGLAEEELRGMETIQYLLPDAQASRDISRALVLNTRLAIAEQRYDDAINLMRMNYQLGQDISKQEFLVCCLVGLAEVQMANLTVIDLIGAPNSPNLYWALTELPRPIIDIRDAMNLDMSLGLRMFPVLLDAETANHTPEEWTHLVATTFNELGDARDLLGGAGFPKQKTLSQLAATGMSLVVYPAAKQRLIDAGMTNGAVEEMSVAQVLLIDMAREYQKIADEYEKWMFVPYADMQEVDFGRTELTDGFGSLLANMLLPAVTATRRAQIRTEWQMNAIRVVEALRMHAAETGRLPASLDDVKDVPVPDNPITEKPYEYRLDGDTAVLDLPFSDGMPGVAWRFEIQLAK